MQNYKKVTYLISALAITGFVVFLIFRGKKEKPDPNRGERPVSKRVIVPREACSIPAEALRPFSNHLDSEGIRTLLTTEYTEDTPLVEMSFMMRNLDGKIKLLKVASVGLSRISGNWGGDYTVDGIGLRMGLGKERSNLRSLLLGEEYFIRSFWLPGGEDAISTAHLKPKFKIPETLGRNQVYKVQLLLLDEILERELLEKQKAEAKRRKEIEEKETITVKVTQRPGFAAESKFIGVYHDGIRHREFYQDELKDQLVLKGPNKLGGELLVSFISKPDRKLVLWAYLKNVTNRDINLPEDADFKTKEKELIQIYLSFADKDAEALKDFKAIAFYLTKNANLPMFWLALTRKGEQPDSLQYEKIPLKIIPGTYYIRAIGKNDQEVPLGKLPIDKEKPKTYAIHLPTEK